MKLSKLVALILPIFLVVGCASTSSSSGSSAKADPRLTGSNEAQFFSRSGFEACVAGGIGTALFCTLTGACDSTEETLAAAAIGCGVGMGANYYLDSKRAQHANEKQQLNAMIADVSDENQKLESLIVTTKDVLADDKATLTKLKSDIEAQKTDRKAVEKQLVEIDANADYLNGLLAKLKKREREWKKVAQAEQGQSTAEVKALNKQIVRLQDNIQVLESELDEMLSMRAGIRVV